MTNHGDRPVTSQTLFPTILPIFPVDFITLRTPQSAHMLMGLAMYCKMVISSPIS